MKEYVLRKRLPSAIAASCSLRRVETVPLFAYAVRIASMILRTARFLCVIYAEICVDAIPDICQERPEDHIINLIFVLWIAGCKELPNRWEQCRESWWFWTVKVRITLQIRNLKEVIELHEWNNIGDLWKVQTRRGRGLVHEVAGPADRTWRLCAFCQWPCYGFPASSLIFGKIASWRLMSNS